MKELTLESCSRYLLVVERSAANSERFISTFPIFSELLVLPNSCLRVIARWFGKRMPSLPIIKVTVNLKY